MKKGGTEISEELILKTCAFTGHRPNKLGGYDWMDPLNLKIMRRIRDIVVSMIEEKDVTRFVFGGALGIDQMAFAVCQKLKREKYPEIELCVAIPFENQYLNWVDQKDIERYMAQKESADEVVLVDTLLGSTYVLDAMAPGEYHPAKMALRNKYMVDQSKYLLAVWDGSESGGTYLCVKYFKSKRDVSNMFRIDPKKM